MEATLGLPRDDAVLTTVAGLAGSGRWTVTRDDCWWYLDPNSGDNALSGWKLHVSASLWNAAETIRRVLPTVTGSGRPWKLPLSVDHLRRQLAPPTPPSQVGKFVTVYAGARHTAVELGQQLADLTADLDSPIILGEQRAAPYGSGYIRFGGFLSRFQYDARTDSLQRMLAPEIPLPPYATPTSAPASASADSPSAQTFTTLRTIRESAKGGVFVVRFGGTLAIAKVGRRFTCCDYSGVDQSVQTEHEYGLLQRLAGAGVAPLPLALLADPVATYLIEELVPGRTIAALCRDGRRMLRTIPPTGWDGILARLRSAIARLHSLGIAHRDLSPDNVLVGPDGRVTMIDFELANEVGDGGNLFEGGTAGFVPEAARDAVDAYARDRYAYTSLRRFLLSGYSPRLEPPARAPSGPTDCRTALAPPEEGDPVPSSQFAGGDPTICLPLHSRPTGRPISRGVADAAWCADVLSASELIAEAISRFWYGMEAATLPPNSLRRRHLSSLYFGAAGHLTLLTQLATTSGKSRFADAGRTIARKCIAYHPYAPFDTPYGLARGYAAFPPIACEVGCLTGDMELVGVARREALQLEAAADIGGGLEKGGAGVTLMLLRMHALTNDGRFLELAVARSAANARDQGRWRLEGSCSEVIDSALSLAHASVTMSELGTPMPVAIRNALSQMAESVTSVLRNVGGNAHDWRPSVSDVPKLILLLSWIASGQARPDLAVTASRLAMRWDRARVIDSLDVAHGVSLQLARVHAAAILTSNATLPLTCEGVAERISALAGDNLNPRVNLSEDLSFGTGLTGIYACLLQVASHQPLWLLSPQAGYAAEQTKDLDSCNSSEKRWERSVRTDLLDRAREVLGRGA